LKICRRAAAAAPLSAKNLNVILPSDRKSTRPGSRIIFMLEAVFHNHNRVLNPNHPVGGLRLASRLCRMPLAFAPGFGG
jgi:hypothetical protein